MQQRLDINWWKQQDRSEPNQAHRDDLFLLAIQHVRRIIDEDFNEGELIACIDDIDYRGYWTASR